MQVRWRFKLQPNIEQKDLMSEWLVTLRKHYNYSLRERIDGYECNNAAAVGAFCDISSRGEAVPSSCHVRKHGVKSAEPFKIKKKTGEVAYRTVGEIQSVRTTRLRKESEWYARIDSDVLQRNLAHLDDAFKNFWKHGRGYPSFKTFADFKSFEYKPGRVKLLVNRREGDKHRYSTAYLPGIGSVKYFDSRAIPPDAVQRTVTITREPDGCYMSVLLQLCDELPATADIKTVDSIVGVDVGVNKLASLSDGSSIENPKPATNKAMKRRIKIRQRRVTRKVKGSKNRAKAGKTVVRLHKKIRDKRDAVQWEAANRIVDTADAVTHEELNIIGMTKRCKPLKSDTGRFMPNGQSAKRGLNRAILDVAWGGLFQKIGWLALKNGKPVAQFHTPHSSQECRKCGHIDKDNRSGENFFCINCGHVDHADTQASRTGVKRTMQDYNLHFKPKKLPVDCGEVTLVKYQHASNGKRVEGKNLTQQLNLFDDIAERIPIQEWIGESPSL